MNALLTDLRETHHLLEERLARAHVARPSLDPDQPRDQYPAIDTYLAAVSRHLGAVVQVLVPAARSHLPDGARRSKEFLAQSRRVAIMLNQVKAKLYGSAYAVGKPWSAVWESLDREYARLVPLELALAEDLGAHRKEGDPDWVLKLHQATLKAPTRPHPHIPQQGRRGQLARAVARRVDAFWDAAEGRMVPTPELHHARDGDGPFVQYLLADPHLESWAISIENLEEDASQAGNETGQQPDEHTRDEKPQS